MIDAQLQARALERLNATFDLYARYNKRDLDELLARKGRDVGIKLFQGYRGRRPVSKGYAVSELRRRTASGLGTRVRDRVLRDKWIPRISSSFPSIKRRVRRGKQVVDLNRQQMLVGQEVVRRAAGRGALAASFLWFRRRSSQAKGSYLVKNKTARVLGQVDSTDNSFRIRGYMDGLALVDTRYAIVYKALNASERDMQTYIKRKQAETVKQTLREVGLPIR